MAGVPHTWATAVAPLGPVAMGSVLWLSRKRPQLTVVLKSRFAFRHDSMMVVTSPTPVVPRDVHADDDPTRSLMDASDAVPYRERTDVWLVGSAYAPAGRPVTVSVVRVALYRDGQPLLDKALYVVGDRQEGGSPPEPFATMPLVYEKAYGGIGFDANPVGVGADERPLAPNVVDPNDAERVAGFGPISRYWKLRRKNVTTQLRRDLESDVASVPEGFDWSYFQAAPEDQRVSYLQGDEWLVLDGLHPTMLRVQSRLPKVHAVARVLPRDPSRSDEFDSIALVADTLAIDADAQTCTVTWRGIVPLASRADAKGMLIAGGIELPGRALDWAQAYRSRVVPQESTARRSVALDRSGVTIVSAPPAEMEDMLGNTTVDAYDRVAIPLAVPSEPTDVSEPTSYRRVAEPQPGSSRDIDGWPEYALATEHEEVTETKTTQTSLPMGEPNDAEITNITELTNVGETTDVGEPNDGEVTNVQDRVVDERPAQHRPIPLAVDTEPGGPPPIDENDLPWLEEAALEPGAASDTDVPPASDDDLDRETSLPPAPIRAADYAAQLRGAGASEQDIAALLDWLDE